MQLLKHILLYSVLMSSVGCGALGQSQKLESLVVIEPYRSVWDTPDLSGIQFDAIENAVELSYADNSGDQWPDGARISDVIPVANIKRIVAHSSEEAEAMMRLYKNGRIDRSYTWDDLLSQYHIALLDNPRFETKDGHVYEYMRVMHRHMLGHAHIAMKEAESPD